MCKGETRLRGLLGEKENRDELNWILISYVAKNAI